MQKKTKGLIAGVAGGALLLGSAGTFALWSDQTTLSHAAITGGAFDLEVKKTTWTWSDISGIPADPAADEPSDSVVTLVPGKQLQGTTEVTTTLDGHHLVADLTIDGVPVGEDWLKVEWELDGVPLGSGTSTRLAADGTQDLTVTIALDDQAPEGGPSEVAKLTWEPGNLAVTLQQLPPTSAL